LDRVLAGWLVVRVVIRDVFAGSSIRPGAVQWPVVVLVLVGVFGLGVVVGALLF
jgi:hypothetical protein